MTAATGVEEAARLTRREVLALALILLLAAALRFTGLAWGLRHPPFSDERSFIEATAGMLARGDLDHRFYEYPGLFFYLLAPLVALLPPEARTGPTGYLVARQLVAAFSLLSVGAIFVLGRRLGSARLGLVAALLLAVSPVDVSTAHMVRPDVVLATFVLLALLAFDRLTPPRPAADVGAGCAIGLAASVKFTGLLLIPIYLLERALAPGHRLGGVLRAGLAAVLVGALATPYAWLRPGAFAHGARYQLAAHYLAQAHATSLTATDNVIFYLKVALQSLGAAGALLAVCGLVLAAREGRRYRPALLFVVVLVAVMSTADLRFPRFLVPATALLALLAARTLEALAAHSRLLAALVTAAALVSPLGDAAWQVRKLAQPSPRDRALDWIAANLPPGARILSLCRDLSLGLDTRRYEVLTLRPKTRQVTRLAAEMDLIVAYPEVATRYAGFEAALRVKADRGQAPFVLLTPRPAPHPRTAPCRLAAASVRTASGSEREEALSDGDPTTVWAAAPTSGTDGDWIEVHFAEPQHVGRVELLLGTPPRPCAGSLHVTASRDGAHWEAVPALPMRPPVEQQHGRRSEAWLVAAHGVQSLRLTCSQRGTTPWEVAELSLAAGGVRHAKQHAPHCVGTDGGR